MHILMNREMINYLADSALRVKSVEFETMDRLLPFEIEDRVYR